MRQIQLHQEDKIQKLFKCCSPKTISVAVKNSYTFGNLLHFEELQLGQSFSNVRRVEFLSGRAAAREALSAYGFRKIVPILRSKSGLPLWPTGIVGSISHKNGYAVAIVGCNRDFKSVGCDIEFSEDLCEEVWSTFATKDEVIITGNKKLPVNKFANVLFSIKESIFKALYPLNNSPTLSIREIKPRVNFIGNTHVMRFSAEYANAVCMGRAVINEKLVASVCTIR